jgi:hypothetical protein
MVALKGEVQDVRQHQAPNTLRSMKERHNKASLDSNEWKRFLLEYSGNVDDIVMTKAAEAKKGATSWTGTLRRGQSMRAARSWQQMRI